MPAILIVKMRTKCSECSVVYDVSEEIRHGNFHASTKKLMELYATYKHSHFKWRTNLQIRQASMELWKNELVALSSDLGLSADVFIEVIFRPRKYYKHFKEDTSFDDQVFFDRSSPDYHAARLSKPDVLIQLKLELITLNRMSDRYLTDLGLYEYKINIHEQNTDIYSILAIIDESSRNHMPANVILSYKRFINKCLTIFRTEWKLSIFMIRFLIHFLLTDSHLI